MVQLLRRQAVMERLGIGRSKFAQMVKDGELPRPVIVSKTVRAWRSDELDAFIESRPYDNQTHKEI